ncbi:hypothetical protein ACO0K0_01535 [Undibacterium sp. SXout11W]|uniref:hypothetical protein n=1 Tax=Undibacterium sp. SXout11W TaxID=3413050 RepID=UPI003BF0E7DF
MMSAMGGMPSLSYGTTATSGAKGSKMDLSNLLNKGHVTINYGSGSASSSGGVGSAAKPLAVSHNTLFIVAATAAAAWLVIKK